MYFRTGITISGGEPLLHPEIIKLLEIAHKNFKRVVLLSNGTIFNQELKDGILNIIKQNDNPFFMQISMDSFDLNIHNQTRGQHDQIVKNISKFIELGVKLNLATVITKNNEDYVLETVKTFSKIVKHFHIIPFKNVDILGNKNLSLQPAPEKLDFILQKLKLLSKELNIVISDPTHIPDVSLKATGAPCMAAFTQLVVDPDLTVRPCDRLVNFKIGNLKESSLIEIWNNDYCKKVTMSPIPLCLTN